jgi:nucleotide-binding universal stress UspA family protein
MPHSKRVLIAVDESDASRRAVTYAAEVLGGGHGFQVSLLHLELPPRMLEWGGSENPEVEDQISVERGEAYRQMENQAIAEGKTMLHRSQAILAEQGIEGVALLVQFDEPLDGKTIAQHVLKTARDHDCGTVVVGRHLTSFWEGLFHHPVEEQLVRTDGGMTIWVVG